MGGALVLAAALALLFFLMRKRRSPAPAQPMNETVGLDSYRGSAPRSQSYVPTAPAPSGDAAMFGSAASTYEEPPLPPQPPAAENYAGYGAGFSTATPNTAVPGVASSAGAAGIGTAAAANRRSVQGSPRTRQYTRDAAVPRHRMSGVNATGEPLNTSPRAARRSAAGAGAWGSAANSREGLPRQYYGAPGTVWYDEWNSDTSPYATAGVGHTYDEEHPPPVAFHMQPGQIVRPVSGNYNMSPVGAFTESSANGTRAPNRGRNVNV